VASIGLPLQLKYPLPLLTAKDIFRLQVYTVIQNTWCVVILYLFSSRRAKEQALPYKTLNDNRRELSTYAL
jgi:hypothetical protein